MKKPISKAVIRNQLNQQIDKFLNQGGEVVQIERGLSGRENPNGPLKPNGINFDQAKTPRTYVPEVVAALEARRNSKPGKTVKTKKKSRKKIIYDDFGEALRWEWVDD